MGSCYVLRHYFGRILDIFKESTLGFRQSYDIKQQILGLNQNTWTYFMVNDGYEWGVANGTWYMDIWFDILGNDGIDQRKTWTFIVPMDPWPLSEKVQTSLQIIIIPQTLFLRRYDWIHRV